MGARATDLAKELIALAGSGQFAIAVRLDISAPNPDGPYEGRLPIAEPVWRTITETYSSVPAASGATVEECLTNAIKAMVKRRRESAEKAAQEAREERERADAFAVQAEAVLTRLGGR